MKKISAVSKVSPAVLFAVSFIVVLFLATLSFFLISGGNAEARDEVKSSLDEFASSLEDGQSLSYGEIKGGLIDGVTVDKVSFSDLNQGLSANGKMRLIGFKDTDSSGALELTNVAFSRSGDVPQEGSVDLVRIEGLTLKDRSDDVASDAKIEVPPHFAIVVKGFKSDGFSDNGIDGGMDLRLSMDYAKDSGELGLSGSQRVAGYISSDFDLGLMNVKFKPDFVDRLDAVSMGQPIISASVLENPMNVGLVSFQFKVDDDGFLDAMFRAAAEQSHQSVSKVKDEYARQINIAKQSLGGKSTVLSGYLDSLLSFVQDSGSLSVSVSPEEPVKLSTAFISFVQNPDLFLDAIRLKVIHTPS